jgi:hypothetical protein
MNVEIHFSPKGNTIIGSHAAYLALDSAIENKSVPCPYGHCIKGDELEIKRLAEYVSLFGYCIRSLAGWRKACELAGTELV